MVSSDTWATDIGCRSSEELTAEAVEADRGVSLALQSLGHLDRLLQSFLRVRTASSLVPQSQVHKPATHVVPKNCCSFSFSSSVLGGN